MKEKRIPTTVRFKESILNLVNKNAENENISVSRYVENCVIRSLGLNQKEEDENYILNKNNILKLKLVGRDSSKYPIEYKFKDIDGILGLEKDILKVQCFNPTFLNEFEDITTYDDEYFYISENKVMSLLYEDKKDFYRDIQEIIIDYIKQNKLPVDYMNNEDDHVISSAIIIKDKIEGGVFHSYTNKDMKDYNKNQYISLIGIYTDWEYKDGKLKLINKYLTREREIDANNLYSIFNFVKDFCNEWDSMIDGNFIWE